MDKALTRIAILCFFLGLAACESDTNRTSRDSDEVNDPPRLVDTFPGDGASEFDTVDPVVLRFSEEIDEDSVTDGGVKLLVELQDRPVSFDFDIELSIVEGEEANTLVDVSVVEVMAESGRFSLSTEYFLNVTTDIKDTGNSEGKDEKRLQVFSESSFITRDGEWQVAERIDLDASGNAFNPQLTSNTSGDIYMAWSQSDGAVNDIWAAKFHIGEGIEEDAFVAPSNNAIQAEKIENTDTGNALAPKIVVTEDGLLAVAWQIVEGASSSIRANIFDGSAWLGEVEIESLSGDASDIAIESTLDGKIVLVWRQEQGDHFSIWSSEFDLNLLSDVTRNQGWTVPIRVESTDAEIGNARSPMLKTNSLGHTYLVWIQSLSDVNRVWSSRFTTSSGWSEPETIDSDSAESSEKPIIDFGPRGDGLALWQQFDGDRYNIRYNRLVSGLWQEADFVEVDNRGDAESPVIGFDDQNNAIAIWRQFDGRNTMVMSQNFSPSLGWNNLEMIGQTTNEIGSIDFSFDSEGNALAIWEEGIESLKSIVSNRYSQFGGWKGETPVESFSGTKSLEPTMTEFFTDGRQLAVWYQIEGDGSYRLAKNTFE